MFFESQIQYLNLKAHYTKCSLRLKYSIWISKHIIQNVLWDSNIWISKHIMDNVLWDSNTVFESQSMLWKMFSETQIQFLSLKAHYRKCSLRLKYSIWISKHITQNVLWDSNTVFESQSTLQKIFFETQIQYLNLKAHYRKGSLRLKYSIWISKHNMENVLWDSNTVFESQSTLWKMFSETQIQYLNLKATLWKMFCETQIQFLSLKAHYRNYSLRLKYSIWISKHLIENVLWDSNTVFESQSTLWKMFFETQIPYLNLKAHYWKCSLRLKYRIWISKHIIENVLWDSNTVFESQSTLYKMFFETQILYLNLKAHYTKCSLRLKYSIWISRHIMENVLWDSKTVFESQNTIFKSVVWDSKTPVECQNTPFYNI
jgi:hypothetical protein